MTAGLKPCPFCGEESALSPNRCGMHYITCSICFADGPRGFARHVAVEGWNTRFPADDETSIQVEYEREACIRILEDLRPRNDPSDWTEFTVTTDTILRLAIEAINRRYPA